jgi:hypothetical protein
MGSRGPLRNPNSRRGMKERGSISPLPLVELQALSVANMPDWLTGSAVEVWCNIVPQALEAGLPHLGSQRSGNVRQHHGPSNRI